MIKHGDRLPFKQGVKETGINIINTFQQLQKCVQSATGAMGSVDSAGTGALWFCTMGAVDAVHCRTCMSIRIYDK